jgi:probable HAF family extracellular repeat protein
LHDKPTPMRVRTAIATLTLLALTVPAGTEDKTLFIELPANVIPGSVSAGGAVVVGSYRVPPAGFFWMPTTRDIFIGGKGAAAVSRDGKVIVGTATDAQGREQAAIWLRAAEWRLLGSVVANPAPCDALISSSYDTSDDGTVIVGLAWNGCNFARAFRWEESTGMVDLGTTVAGRSSRANGVSGDGRVVVGWQEASTGPRQGARWIGGAQQLFTGPTGIVGEAHATNRDGSVVVGQTCLFATAQDPLPQQSAWISTSEGEAQCLATPRQRPPGFIGTALATNEDGRVVGGGHGFGLESESVLWIDRTPAYLRDFLRSHGVPNAFEGWVNTGYITDVSPDGRILVGYGAGRTDFQGYLVILGSDVLK